VPPTATQIRGAQGEGCALAHYERLGFRLIERNHRARFGEIDLIVADAGTLVFAEVKTRLAGGLDPLLSLTPTKRRRMRRLAAAWLVDHPDRPRAAEVRIDAVAVVLDVSGALVSLEQFEDVA
jgi:putative endonuclease